VGVPQENFSVRWTGTILPPKKGSYSFHVDSDGVVKVFVNGKLVVDKNTPKRAKVSNRIKLDGGQPVEVKIEYVHATGGPSLHVTWSGPGLERQVLMASRNAGVQ
jgi:archaellum component FlaG (FlaF/FlaG flagellin family)